MKNDELSKDELILIYNDAANRAKEAGDFERANFWLRRKLEVLERSER